MDQTMLVAGTTVLLRETLRGAEVLLIRRPDRGSFASAWVFPGGVIEQGDLVDGESEQENASRAAARECEEEVGLRPRDLTVFSCWVPPAEAPKRARTWFFLAAETRGEITPSPGEVVDWRWMAPADALAQHAEGEIELFPPTWVTLHALAQADDLAAALATASVPELYATHIIGEGIFVWGGDGEHPEGGAGRHRLETGSRPWRYLRD